MIIYDFIAYYISTYISMLLSDKAKDIFAFQSGL